MIINSVALVGRVGRDPQIRHFESGKALASFTLAVKRRRSGGKPDWFNLEIWGQQVQVVANYVKQGSLLSIVGTLKINTWIDRTTCEQRSKPVIRIDRLELLDSKRDNEQIPYDSNPTMTKETPF
uniref:Single-stranded DNA-binding protein n=1 Tax=Paulinella chromatophora TaxID=39717 RepID=B1X4M4_PAUCH|nr:single-strand DNA-binding protein [Paulinella chromatophora]ACB42893.1 single-strand DNA-binding protein [Paulinella chromatophora]